MRLLYYNHRLAPLFLYNNTTVHVLWDPCPVNVMESLRIVLGLSVSPSCEVTDKGLYILVVQLQWAGTCCQATLPQAPNSLDVSQSAKLLSSTSCNRLFYRSTVLLHTPALHRGFSRYLHPLTKHNRHMFWDITLDNNGYAPF